MAQNSLDVAGIDVTKDKVDVCIRSLSLKRTFASTADGRRELASWLRRQKIGKAVMEASGGYEREWAKALRNAAIEVPIVDPKRVRSFAGSAGRLAKNDTIDAEMIAGSPKPSAMFLNRLMTRSAETGEDRECAPGPARRAGRTAKRKRAFHARHRAEGAGAAPEEGRCRACRARGGDTATIEATPRFAELAEIIESVPGLGRIASAGLIAAMPELGQVNNKIAGALLGVARTMTTVANGEVSARSRTDAARCEICSTWPVWAPRHGTTPCSRPSICAWSPKVR